MAGCPGSVLKTLDMSCREERLMHSLEGHWHLDDICLGIVDGQPPFLCDHMDVLPLFSIID